MIKNLTLIVLLIFSFQSSWSQIKITGTITDQDGTPLNEAIVTEKGTTNTIKSDSDGLFTIIVKDSSSILTFSYIGLITREIPVIGKSKMSVILKAFVIYEAWDQKIAVYANSGLINNPIGGQLEFSIPAFNVGIITTISYQTNLAENQFFNANLGIHHIRISSKGLGLDLDLLNRRILSDNGFKLKANAIETSWSFYQYHLILGYNYIDLKEGTDLDQISSSGATLGTKYWIKNPVNLLISGKVSIYKDLAEYQLVLQRSFKRINTFIKYYHVDSFSELSIGIGLEFTYYLKKQRNQYE